MIDVTNPTWRTNLRELVAYGLELPQEESDALLDYVDELEGLVAELRDENESLNEMVTDLPRHFFDKMRNDV